MRLTLKVKLAAARKPAKTVSNGGFDLDLADGRDALDAELIRTAV